MQATYGYKYYLGLLMITALMAEAGFYASLFPPEQWQTALPPARQVFLGGGILIYVLLLVVYTALWRESVQRRRLAGIEREAARAERTAAMQMEQVVAIQREVAHYRLDLTMAMQAVAERAQTLTRAQGAVVEMLEDGDMVYRAASGSSVPHMGKGFKAAGSLSGHCVKENTVFSCDDLQTDKRVDRAACRKMGLRSIVVVPLWHNGKPVGVLKASSSRANVFAPKDVATLELLAGVLSAAISGSAASDLIWTANTQLAEMSGTLISQKAELEKANIRLKGLAMAGGSAAGFRNASHASWVPE